MTERDSPRQFSREFKLAALSRMAAGANVSALAKELGVRRKYLYQWRDRFRAGGSAALRSRGRPTRSELLETRTGEAIEASAPAPMPPPDPPDELARAQARIVELERKIGRQELELDFFQQALRHVGDTRQPSGASGGTASTRSSRR